MMFSELLTQFRQEVHVLRMLNHPHIVKLYEVFESKNYLHVVTEFVQGGELFDYLVERPDRLLSEAEASGIVRQVAWAIADMHKNGIIHRDIKLENILVAHKPLDEEIFPTIKIIDFGLAKVFTKPAPASPTSPVSPLLQESNVSNTAHTFFGTLGYIAPEMMKRNGYAQSVDNWALGVLTYVLLCGVFPFDDDPATTSAARAKGIDYTLKYPPWASNISDSAKDLLKKLLEPNPSKRVSAGRALLHPWVCVCVFKSVH